MATTADYGLRYLKIAPAAETDLSGYYQCTSTTTGALKVVASSATPGEGEIKLSAVTPYKSAKQLAVNDYVVNVSCPIGTIINLGSIVGLPVFQVNAIVKDSFTYNDKAPTETNVEIEDSDDPFSVIKSDSGTKGFVVRTYDMGEEAYAYLMGFTKEGSTMKEPIDFELGNQAVELKTRKHGSFPSKIYRYARMSVKVSRTGTIGKSGFPDFELTFTKLANYDASGTEICGFEWDEAEDND